jgi:hypothetical protein
MGTDICLEVIRNDCGSDLARNIATANGSKGQLVPATELR